MSDLLVALYVVPSAPSLATVRKPQGARLFFFFFNTRLMMDLPIQPVHVEYDAACIYEDNQDRWQKEGDYHRSKEPREP